VEIVIRSFRFPDDFYSVISLWSNAGEGIHLGQSDSYTELKKKFEFDPGLFLVAEKDGQIIGSVLGGFDGRRGIVYHLAVCDEERGKGLGSLLMEQIESLLHQRGCIRAYLLVTNENLKAMSFYEKRGWSEMDLHIYAKNIA
jgi:GNAT superfamily N-acetyltransferase